MNKVNIQGLDGKLTKIYGDECEKNVVGIVIFNNDGKFFFDSEFKNQVSDEEVEALLLRGAVVDRGGKYYRPSSFNSEKVSFSDAIVNPEDIEVDLSGYATKSYVDSKIADAQLNGGTSNGETNQSLLIGKSIVFFGDSITTNQNASKIYAQVLQEMIPFSKATIMGVAGSSVSSTGKRGTQYKPMSSRYTQIPDADIITIFMGTNDWGQEVPLGTIDDTTDVSFYGALNYSLLNLINAHPNSRIIWITPLHRYGHGEFNGVQRTYDHIPSPLGHTLKDYVDAIKEVCERYSVPVIDMFNVSNMSPSVPAIKSKYFVDGLHPNNLGHEKMAHTIKKWLEIYSADLAMVDIPANPGGEITYYTITYKYVCNGASIKTDTTQSVVKGTAMTFSTSKAPTINGYEVASVSPTSATINSNTTVTYTYNVKEDSADPEVPETPETPNVYTMQLGNKYAGAGTTINRVSLKPKGIFIPGGVTVSPKAGYKWGGYKVTDQNGASAGGQLWSNYTTDAYTAPASGQWAGFVVGRTDDSDFDLTVDSIYASDYLDSTDPNIFNLN